MGQYLMKKRINFAVTASVRHNSLIASCIVSLFVTSVSSLPAQSPPIIITQPQGPTLSNNTTFTVIATGTPPLSYQWYEYEWGGNNLLAGATNTSLILTNVQMTNAGYYLVIVSNMAGSVTSSNAILMPGLTNLTADCRPRSIVLAWDTDCGFDIDQWFYIGFLNGGFNVYRSTTSGGPYVLLTPTPLNPGSECTDSFVDTSVTANTPYYYVITYLHTNEDANSKGPLGSTYESLYSNEAQATTCCDPTSSGLWVDDGPNPQELAQWIMGPGVTVTNAKYTGATVAQGIFGNGIACGLPIDSGVILSSGYISSAVGPNLAPDLGSGPSEDLGEPGDAELDTLVPANLGVTHDAAVLEFDVTSPSNSITFQYIFASAEYPDFVDQFDDVCGIFVDETNIALIPGTLDPVSVDTVNDGDSNSNNPVNSQYFVQNYCTDVPPPININYNGLTTLLTAQTQITPNIPHHIKIAVADDGDYELDSAILIKVQISCQTPPPVLTENPATHLLSWSWNGPAPFEWEMQELYSEEQVGGVWVYDWADYWYFDGDVTNTSSIGMDGIFRIRGDDDNDQPITPWSNEPGFADFPSISMTSPANNSTYVEPATIQITTSPAYIDTNTVVTICYSTGGSSPQFVGPIYTGSNVFWSICYVTNGVLYPSNPCNEGLGTYIPLATFTNSPYSFTWRNVMITNFTTSTIAAHGYYIGAMVTYANGCEIVSEPVWVRVLPEGSSVVASLQASTTANTLTCYGTTNTPYTVQYCTNLSTGQWFDLSTNVPDSNGVWTVVDPIPTDPQRFYRVKN